MENFAVICTGALIIGLTLGLLGSGGSAITVPVLVYFLGHAAKQSIAESMAIVGLISLFAALPYARAGQVDWRNVWFFGIPGMLGAFVGAWFGGQVSGTIQLVVFGIVLLVAACVMFQKPGQEGETRDDNLRTAPEHSPMLFMAMGGTFVGMVTGFVGVGGGFLIVPALILFGRLPMRLAIGSSLVIITLNAVIGYAKYHHYLATHQMSIDVKTVLLFVIVGALSSMIGKSLNTRLNQRMLKIIFAVFLVLIGGFVILYEGSILVLSR